MFGRAVESPLVRGGLAISAGLITGNVIGFFRVALTAYLLGTHSAADALAVAVGPIDTLNSVLINTMIFAFVPDADRARGRRARGAVPQAEPGISRVFLPAGGFDHGVRALVDPRAGAGARCRTTWAPPSRSCGLLSVSSLAAGTAALHAAFLFTHRRFAPTAFHQASLNFFTIVGALSLWRVVGVYGFAIGYAVGAWVQLGIVYFAARSSLRLESLRPSPMSIGATCWPSPASFLLYAGLIALNVIVTRAYATHAGPGMAAALDYSMRCLTVPLAYLVTPVSNSLLPEIARLRSRFQLRQAFRLDR